MLKMGRDLDKTNPPSDYEGVSQMEQQVIWERPWLISHGKTDKRSTQEPGMNERGQFPISRDNYWQKCPLAILKGISSVSTLIITPDNGSELPTLKMLNGNFGGNNFFFPLFIEHEATVLSSELLHWRRPCQSSGQVQFFCFWECYDWQKLNMFYPQRKLLFKGSIRH